MLGRFCPEDILRYRSIQAISCRNGADVAICEISIPDAAQDNNQSSLWLAPLDVGETEQFTSGDGGEGGAVWAPDATSFAFISSRTGSTQVHVIQRGGGESRAITKLDSVPLALKWKPDGKTLLVTA